MEENSLNKNKEKARDRRDEERGEPGEPALGDISGQVLEVTDAMLSAILWEKFVKMKY